MRFFQLRRRLETTTEPSDTVFGASVPRLVKIRLSTIAALSLSLVVIIALASDQIALFWHRKHQQPITDNLAVEINTFIVQYFAHSVKDLAKAKEIVDACARQSAVDNPALLRVLNTAQDVLDVSLVYVMDTEGNVIGSSVSPEGQSLTGEKYPFRPYFRHALNGTPYVFPAVGLTTSRKGFYFSAPVYAGDEKMPPIGVVVLKTRSEAIDAFFSALRGKLDALLISPDGVIFAATQASWNFHTAWPVAENRLRELKEGRQFNEYALQPLPFSLENTPLYYEGKRASVALKPLQIEGWHIATLEAVPFPWLAVLGLSCVVLSVGVLSGVLVFHTHREEQLSMQVQSRQEASERSQAAYLASVRELETIFSASLVGIILVREGRIINANKRMTEMFGYTKEEILSGDIRQFFASRRSFRRFVKRHLHLLLHSDVEQAEYQLRRKDGVMIPCTLSGKAIHLHDLAEGTVWVVEDISRRKAVEIELEQARVAAEAASVAKGEFLANMSHEIRTPMNGIVGLTNLLLSSDLGREQRDHLELIQRSSIRLMNIINDILDFSKLEVGRYDLEQRPFSLRGALKDVVRPMELIARKKHLQFKVHIDSTLPETIVGDQTKVMQVLTNLIDNSLKFTTKGCISIQVHAQRGEQSPENMILFEVADTGIGIVDSYRDKVFESFTQADSSHSRKFGGTGLGLSISRGLVRLMGGEIWFDSEPRKGTKFYFTIPLAVPDDIATNAAAESTHNLKNTEQLMQGSGKRILVAEDEYINSILMRALLKQAGYQVTVVKNGREAVNAWRGGVFDCILMDIQMPEMDGYEAVARIREAETNGEHIPVIAMTAHALSGDRLKCLAVGMDAYVSKPIDGSLVLELLRKHLSGAPVEASMAAQAEIA